MNVAELLNAAFGSGSVKIFRSVDETLDRLRRLFKKLNLITIRVRYPGELSILAIFSLINGRAQ